ncbi:conserved hypothetical protein [Ricinus communis]|uniref:Uncharacterized protein n=1 Tax=Ricinus communis TaxID=3988 RepID=B9SW86_RICCO|nr:conserved hypothetical protein [Ricinus communis]
MGECMVMGSFPIPNSSSVLLGELEAIRADSQAAISLLNGSDMSMDETNMLIQDIKQLGSLLEDETPIRLHDLASGPSSNS